MQSDRLTFPSDEQQVQTIPVGYYNVQTYSLKRFLSIAKRRIRVIVIVATTVFGVSLAWSLTRTPIYMTSFQVLVEPIKPKVSAAQVGFGESIEQTSYPTLIQVLRSPKILTLVAESLKSLYPDLDFASLSNNIEIIRIKETNIVNISYNDKDPEKVRAVATKLAETYLNYGRELKEISIQQGISFVEQELPKTQQRYNILQQKLESFRQKYSLIDPLNRAAELSKMLNDVQQQQEVNKAKIIELTSAYKILQGQIGFNADQAIAASRLSESPRYQDLLNQVQQVDAKIALESQRFQSDSPQVQALKEQRQSLLPLLDREAERILGVKRSPNNTGNLTGVSLDLNKQLVSTANQLKILQTQVVSLKATEERLKNDFALAPSLLRQYTDLQRQLAVTNSSLERFLITRENLKVEAAQKGEAWNLISNPYRPYFPVSPNTPQNLTLGLLGSLFLAAAAAILAEKLDDVFHSPSDLQQILRLPILGTIPFRQELKDASRSSNRSLPNSEKERQSLVSKPSSASKAAGSKYYSYGYNSSRFVESFRTLHTSIKLLNNGSSVGSLVISSALPSDGKSTTAYQLAVASAAMGQRVLLVDADFRRPRVHVRSSLPNQQGLSTAIATDIEVLDVIQQSALDERLFILTAGQIPPDPTRLLASPKMRQIMGVLASNFDLVVYDTPPVLGFADSLLLTSHTDGCVLVVGLGYTERTAVSEALTAFQSAGSTILGVVANCLKKHTADDLVYGQTYGRYYYTERVKTEQVIS
jgi:capsular exopolysaccharide synthesis family protein